MLLSRFRDLHLLAKRRKLPSHSGRLAGATRAGFNPHLLSGFSFFGRPTVNEPVTALSGVEDGGEQKEGRNLLSDAAGCPRCVAEKGPEFRKRVETRVLMLDGCNTPRAQSIRSRSVDLIARAIAVNSGMFCAFLYPFALMGLGLSTLQRSLRKFAALSRTELKSVAPERFGIAIT